MSANEPMATPAGAAGAAGAPPAAGSEELLERMRRELGELSPAAVLAALANPFVTAEAIELVAAHARLLAFYEVRRELTAAGGRATTSGSPWRAIRIPAFRPRSTSLEVCARST